MITADQLIEIGRYNKAHGINGEISATFDCDTMAVGELSALVSPMDGIFVPFFVNGIRPKNNDTLLLKIDGISNETQLNASSTAPSTLSPKKCRSRMRCTATFSSASQSQTPTETLSAQ